MGAADTIYALASGAGISAVAIVRISGDRALAVARDMAGRELPPRRAVRAGLRSVSGEILDDGLVIAFPKGRSFTGEGACELHLHGSRAVILAVLEDLSARGLRVAEPGEFSRRAFLNGKIDLMEVEGLADLLAARTEGQRRQALQQMQGEASEVFEAWRKYLIRILAHVEALVDFSDEAHVAESVPAPLMEATAKLEEDIRVVLTGQRRGERMRDGYRVVLAGPPNAGKSSLFNALLAREAAMVSDIPGTTRDVLEGWLDIQGLPVLLMDTAGLRPETEDRLEAEGIRRSRARAETADLVLWLGAPDVDSKPEPFDSSPLQVWNKADLAPAPEEWLPVSASSGAGIEALIGEIGNRLMALADLGEPALITRERHREALERVCGCLARAQVMACGQHLEIVAEELRQAAVELGRLTGRVDVEDLLDVIFRDFCIGK